MPGHSKAGEQVEESSELVVERGPRFVSRGGEKLDHALERSASTRRGWTASTSARPPAGSRTSSCSAGAARVIALDVGYGQLHPRLRDDPRVTVLERVNARELTSSRSRRSSSSATSRSSRSGRRCRRRSGCAAPGWEAVVLVKPQFEAGRAAVGHGGVVTSNETRARVLREVAEAASAGMRRPSAS